MKGIEVKTISKRAAKGILIALIAYILLLYFVGVLLLQSWLISLCLAVGGELVVLAVFHFCDVEKKRKKSDEG